MSIAEGGIIQGGSLMQLTLFAVSVLSLFQFDALASNHADVFLNQSQRSQLVDIIDQKYEPITQQQPYQDTCSRQVVDRMVTRCTNSSVTQCSGGGTVCTTRPQTICNSSGCRTIPRQVCSTRPRVCRTVPRQSCNTFPVYRTDYYSCTKYRTVVVGQRLVKTYNHKVEVVLDDSVQLADQNLLIKVSVDESRIQPSLSSSFLASLLPYSIQVVGQNDSGAAHDLSERIVIRAIDAAKIKSFQSSEIADLELGYEAFKFNLKNGAELADLLDVSVELIRNRRFWFDKTIYEGTVDGASLNLVSQGADLNAVVPLQMLGLEDELTRFRYDLTVSLKLKEIQALNSRDFAEDFNKVIGKRLKKTHASF